MIQIDPKQNPPKVGENWRIVHPNDGHVEFVLPPRAATVCVVPLLGFKEGKAYSAKHYTDGWVVVYCKDEPVRMPEYIMKRHFDVECFIRGRKELTPEDLERATPFEYKPTLPMDKRAVDNGEFID
jgi:hypothetical protein